MKYIYHPSVTGSASFPLTINNGKRTENMQLLKSEQEKLI